MHSSSANVSVPLHDIYKSRLETLLAHPKVDDAVTRVTRRVCGHTLLVLEEPSKFTHLILESLLIFLHYDYAHFGRGRGATKSALLDLTTTHGIGCARSITMLLNRMLDLNRIVLEIDSRDKRLKRLVPTEVMLADHLAVSVPFLETLPLIDLDHPYIRRTLSDLSEFARYRYAVGHLYSIGADPVRPFNGPKTSLTNRTRGMAVGNYLCLLNIEAFGTLTPDKPCPINISQLSEQIGISRAHMRNMLDDLTGLDLMHFEHGSSQLTLLKAFTNSVKQVIVCTMILCHEALKTSARLLTTDQERLT